MQETVNFTDIKWGVDSLISERALEATSCGVVISDVSLPDTPIIYCNPAFEQLTGYSKTETLGNNCRFLQGTDTDPITLSYLRSCILGGQECQVVLRNYRKNGTPFWNELKVLPLHNTDGRITHFVGIQTDVSDRMGGEEVLSQQVKREQLIAAIATRIRQSLDLVEILNTTVQEVRSFLQTDRVVIYQFAPDMNGMVVSESVGFGWTASLRSEIQDTCFQSFQSSAGTTYGQGRKRAISNIYNAGLTDCHIKLLEQFEVKANLIVPIILPAPLSDYLPDQQENNAPAHPLGKSSTKLWGLLIAHQCSSAREWQDSELNLLDQLSGQIAIAIHQSELYSRVQAELQERRQTEARARAQAEQLAQTLVKLKRTQLQLVQNEKMSSLGQLVAGIAHEINNPVSFIHGNVSYAQDYVSSLMHLLNMYQQHYPQPVTAIQSELDQLDLDFLTKDLNKVLNSMAVGTDRIRQIVLSLRNFSRLDEAEIKQVDIHDGIDNTLLILQHRLKSVGARTEIQVIRDYGDLPLVECYPSQLNQVFMNLLNNSIDALEELIVSQSLTVKPGISQADENLLKWVPTIRVSTNLTAKSTVLIRFSDNGNGIPEAVRSRVFDPFFTTKPIGKGTGLGLSISHQIIVERHGGKIGYLFQPGQGTTFEAEIPLRQ